MFLHFLVPTLRLAGNGSGFSGLGAWEEEESEERRRGGGGSVESRGGGSPSEEGGDRAGRACAGGVGKNASSIAKSNFQEVTTATICCQSAPGGAEPLKWRASGHAI